MRYIHRAKRMRFLAKVLAVATFALIGVWWTPALGQTTAIWGGGTGNWTNAPNWSCFCIPNGNVNVNIGNYFAAGNLNGTVILNTPASVNLVALGNGAIGTLEVSGTTNTLTTSTLTVGTSSGGTGALSIAGGLVNDSQAAIGLETGATGTVTVSGSGAQWNSSGQLEIGQQGKGTLTIQSGAMVTSANANVGEFAGSSGSVTVGGAGSRLNNSGTFYVGWGGKGTLSIQNGGAVNDNTGGIGNGSAVTESGAGSQWNNSSTLGIGSGGQLAISGGGVVNSASATIGEPSGANGSVTLSGAGSQWNLVGSSQIVEPILVENGSLAISNGGTVNAAGTFPIVVGLFGRGSVVISKGGVLNNQTGTAVGWEAGSRGSITVKGSGSMWNDSDIDIGLVGQGSLTIQNGGVVNISQAGTIGGVLCNGCTPGSGTVLVSGTGSQWNNGYYLDVGETGTDTLTIENGGVVTDNSPAPASGEASALVGVKSGGTGIVTVRGAGTQWNNLNGPVALGGYYFSGGNGTVNMNAGATGMSVGLDIGATQGGTGTFTMTDPGTTWTNSGGKVIVGDAGAGTLTAQNGAALLNSSDLIIGNQSGGNGILTISGGGQVSNVNGTIGGASSSMGTVTVGGAGSQWNSSGSLNIGINGTGSLTVENGGLVSAGTLANPGTITIGTLGTVDAKGGTLQGNVVNDGLMDPLGTINLVGSYTQQPGGILSLDVAGTGTGQYGQIDITGSGTFDGTLDLDFTNHFAPATGETFDFINVGGSGDFSGLNVEITGLKPGFNYSGGFSNGEYEVTALNNGISAPEPGTWLLLAISLLGVAILSRQKPTTRENNC